MKYINNENIDVLQIWIKSIIIIIVSNNYVLLRETYSFFCYNVFLIYTM